MIRNDLISGDLDELCDRLLDHTIRAAEIKRLESLVRISPAARRAYIEIMNLHASLHAVIRREAVSSTQPGA